MKYIFLLLLLLMVRFGISQDQILTKAGETLQVRVLQEEKKTVSCYDWNDPLKKIRHLDKKMIKKIRYEEPPHNTGSIAVRHDQLSGKNLYADVTAYLLQSGYELEKLDIDALKVITKKKANHRLVVKIDDHQALFSCYKEIQNSSEKSFSTGAENVIRLQAPDKPEPQLDEFPGEEKVSVKDKSFGTMEKVCRNYLLNDKGTLEFVSD